MPEVPGGRASLTKLHFQGNSVNSAEKGDQNFAPHFLPSAVLIWRPVLEAPRGRIGMSCLFPDLPLCWASDPPRGAGSRFCVL